MRGVAAGALIGGGAGALTSGGLWKGIGKTAARGGVRGLNLFAGNPSGAFRAARQAGSGPVGAAWASALLLSTPSKPHCGT